MLNRITRLLRAAAFCSAAWLAACSANGGGGSGSTGIPVKLARATPPVVSVSVSPVKLDIGGTADATWNSDDATSCSLAGAWSGAAPMNDDEDKVLGPFTTPGVYQFGVTCTGPGGSTTTLQSITVGNLPAPSIQFDAIPSVIAPGQGAWLTWSTTDATSCTGSGGTGSDGWEGAHPTSDATGFSVGTISTQGSYQYVLTCVGSGGSTQVTRILSVTSSAAPPAPTINFTDSPALIQPGQTTTLSWTTSNATSCAASGGDGSDGWSGAQATASASTTIGPIAAAGVYSYTLTCTGSGGSIAKSINLNVSTSAIPPAITVDINVTPTHIVAGSSANLTWVTTNATACTASGSWSGVKPLLGAAVSTGTLYTAGNYSYTLTCTGTGGSNSGTAVLTVDPAAAIITAFAAVPPVILTGQSTYLTWLTADATACTGSGGASGDGWAGPQAAQGAAVGIGPIATAGTYIYTVQCSGPGGTSTPRSVSVTVSSANPGVAQVTAFTAVPSTITVGHSSSLVWATLGATSCTASGGTGSWSGAEPTSSVGTSTGVINTAGSYTYILTCTGPGGAALPSSVVVNVVPVSSPSAIVSAFTVLPSTIQVGDSALLAWTTINATACTAGGGTGSWSGSEPTTSVGTSTGTINTASTYTYTLTCHGTDNVNTTSSVTLNVTSAPPPPPAITSFKATPSSLLTGHSTSLSWSTTTATACAGTGGTGTDGWINTQPTNDAGLSIGPYASAGIYIYTLTCSGPGGTSTPAIITVDVTSTPPTPTIAAFVLLPTTVQTGQSVLATWASLNATGCTASGGTTGDGWTGAVPATSVGTTIGPINTTGNVTYTLTCAGAGGNSAPSTQTITVTAAAPPATILTFAAVPTAIQVGQSALLNWVTGNATSCTGTGGTGSWAGAKPTVSVGTSTGIINTAGNYTYTLTCSGDGGTSLPATAQVAVTNVAPPASIVSLIALPSTVQVGQSTTLTWVTSGASACTASGGTGTDGWSGSVSTQGAADLVGPFNTAGTYVYTLTCTGVGGTSLPTSTSVTVNQVQPAASIVSFTATPTTTTVGQPVSLAWTTLNATSCTATGGSGSDGWSGAQGTLALANIVTAPATAGTVTYTLTCTGSGGTSPATSVHVTVNAATPLQPTVALLANGTNPAQVQPGGAIQLSWSSTGALSCTASGGEAGWAGTQAANSGGVTVTPVTVPGTYTYTLTCSGLGGTGSSSVQVTVSPSSSYNCGIPGLSSIALATPAASVTTSQAGLCILSCTATGAGNVIDSIPSTYATIGIPLALAGTVTMAVNDSATFPAGRQVGFVLTNGTGLVNLSLLGGVSVQTTLNGTVQETATTAGLLSLQAAGLLSVDQNSGFAGFTTTKQFNGVQLVAGGLASVGSSIKVYSACVSLH